MTPGDKQQMLDELMKGVPAGTYAHAELEKLCLSELNRIEPFFDQILERELKTCVAILVSVMTAEQRKDISRRLHDRQAQVALH